MISTAAGRLRIKSCRLIQPFFSPLVSFPRTISWEAYINVFSLTQCAPREAVSMVIADRTRSALVPAQCCGGVLGCAEDRMIQGRSLKLFSRIIEHVKMGGGGK